jgi:hypothetical protein
MLQWNLYSNKAPQLNGSEKLYNRDFPWYDSNQLKQLYPDKNTRRQALFFLFYIPDTTFDTESYGRLKDTLNRLLWEENKITREVANDIWEVAYWGSNGHKTLGEEFEASSTEDVIKFIDILKESGKIDDEPAERLKGSLKNAPFRFRPTGIEGARLSLTQAEKEYETISSIYPNGTVPTKFFGDQSPRYFFYGWLGDRRNHGLKNTVDEFTGYFDGSPGCDEYLTKNWKYWDLVKFIAGYERWNPKVPEAEGISYIIPQTLRAFGFPVSFHSIEPIPLGASGVEWSVSLPKYVSVDLKNNFPDYKILFGPGNTFGLYAVGDGLEKDGIKEVWSGFVYLMKKP